MHSTTMASTTPTHPPQSQQQVREFLMQFQDTLTAKLESIDGGAGFQEDQWHREKLGQGRTRVMSNGRVFEHGGVNFSEISSNNMPATVLQQHPELQDQVFWAAGVSLVLHPLNPHCPTVHLNYRYFEAGSVWWFGGGTDLTPYYPYRDDCRHWHHTIKQSMDRHDPHYYPAFKYWCDHYFYNHHRSETRGIGGSFYDYQDGQAGLLIQTSPPDQADQPPHPALSLTQDRKTWQQLFAFHQDNAHAFLPAYLPIIQQRQSIPWKDAERQFQLYRRGRYVEFNLLYDRGTLFGLQSKGRTESILMSLPPLVRWQYNFTPKADTPEAALTEQYLHRNIDWLAS